MKTYTVVLSDQSCDKTYKNIKANNILDARQTALSKWGKPDAVVNMCWLNPLKQLLDNKK